MEMYNHGEIKGNKYVGGIIGKAEYFDNDIIVKCSYNTGNIKGKNQNNGGIIGGANELLEDTNKIIIQECFTTGKNSSVSANQISPKYANVEDCYYISTATNNSDYGIPTAQKYFKWTASNNTSCVFTKLRNKNYAWALDGEMYITLSWETESWQIRIK